MTIFEKHASMHPPESSTHAPGRTGIPRWAGTRRRRYPYDGLESPSAQKIRQRRKKGGIAVLMLLRTLDLKSSGDTTEWPGYECASKSPRRPIRSKRVVDLEKSGEPNTLQRTKAET